MNNRTELLTQSYKPELAITVYKAGYNDFYLESHSINDAGQIQEGKPLQQETIQAMVDLFFDERKSAVTIKGIIPQNLLAYEVLPGGNIRIIWSRPAEIRVIHFASVLKLPTAKVWVPALIYKVENRRLKVYAVRSNARPNPKTKLYRAPFHNVNDAGEVCLGNAKVNKPKESSFDSFIKYWEDLFWLSEFSHVNGGEPVKTDMHKVWSKLIKSKTKLKWSDIDELKITKSTFQTILK